MTRATALRKATRASKVSKSTSSQKKAKNASPAKKNTRAIAKPAKTQKKVTVSKAVAQEKYNNKAKLLELALLCDCTGSMHSWIDRAKRTLSEIINNVVSSTNKLKVRVTFVGYRDHCDTERFSIQPFSDDIQKVKDYISKVTACGGGDHPEDVVGGLNKCLEQKWTPGSIRQVFLICDAPCHGQKYHSSCGDSYPNGSPDGLELEPLMKSFEK